MSNPFRSDRSRLTKSCLAATAVSLLSVAGVAPAVLAQGAPMAEQHFNTPTDARLAAFHFRSIGPASMGGRLDDIAVSESNPNVIYIGYAVGGVFKSENNGTTFEPVFQSYNTASIGDIAVDPKNPDVAYIGTGEPNNRQTASFGDGIYKTTDGGKTFTHIGLEKTQTIARIVIDPRNTNVVYSRRPAISLDRVPTAASSSRRTAARHGARSPTSTRTQASPTL